MPRSYFPRFHAAEDFRNDNRGIGSQNGKRQLEIIAPNSTDQAPKPINLSMPFDLSAGVQINTKSAGEWLIIKAQALERHWTPTGMEPLIDRD
jgi:hypothetical protein